MADSAAVIHARLMQRCRLMSKLLAPVVTDVVEELEREIKRQAGSTDHTLLELEEMGHPYKAYGLEQNKRGNTVKISFRRGVPKRFRALLQASLGHDIKLVHVQSGTLYSAIYSYVRASARRILGVAGVDDNKVPYLKYVIFGTRYMVPRDFIGRAKIIARPKVHHIVRDGINHVAREMNLQGESGHD